MMASLKSTMVTPCSPQTFPCPFQQKKEVFSSSPSPISLFKSTKIGAILPILPQTLKWVSKMTSTHLNPGIFPAFSQYSVQLVPFRISDKLVPLTEASGMVFEARPTELAKQMTPQGEPYPYVQVSYVMAPAELPDIMISSLNALSLTKASSSFSEPSSFSHALACLAWSPPVKQRISALSMIYKFDWPLDVDKLAVS